MATAVVCCTAFLSLATLAFAAPDVRWGPPASGFQAGISEKAESPHGPALEVTLQNLGPEPRDLRLVLMSFGATYDVKVSAIRGREAVPVFDVRVLREPPSSLPAHRDLRLVGGSAYTFTFPLKWMIGVVNRSDVPLAALLKQGYSVRASVQVLGTTVVTANLAWSAP